MERWREIERERERESSYYGINGFSTLGVVPFTSTSNSKGFK